jgi:hypothetical protein
MNEETKAIMLVGSIRKALNELCEYTGLDYSLYIPDREAEEAYVKLEEAYTEFFKLPLQERLYKSGMSVKENE